jgi:hypothetical protein
MNTKHTWNSKVALSVASSLILTCLVLVQTINQVSFSHDFSSYVAAINYLFEHGSGPYTDFWDIKPVYLFIILSGFFSITGISLLNAYLVYALFLFSFFLSFHLYIIVCKLQIKLLGIFITLLLGVVCSNLFYKMFFPSEIIGLVLILLSLLILRRTESFGRLVLGLSFASIAGQTKEVYLFCTIALIIFLVSNKLNRMKVIAAFVIANLAVGLGGLYFLIKTHALGQYLQMTRIKSEMFQWDPIYNFIKFPLLTIFSYTSEYTLLGFATPLIFSSIFFLGWTVNHFKTGTESTFKRFPNLKIEQDLRGLLLVLASIILGVTWQGKVPTEHYAIPLLPIIILVMLSFLDQSEVKSKFVLFLAALILFPNVGVLKNTFQSIAQNSVDSRNLIHRIITEEDAKKYRVTVERCLQVAYGWESGAYYYYSNSRPCSKYFLSPLVVGSNRLTNDLVLELAKNPPSEIVYNPEGAGLNVTDFESAVFPYSRVLKNCFYQYGSSNLYKSRTKEKLRTAICIKSVVEK